MFPIPNFTKILPVGATMVHVDRRMDKTKIFIYLYQPTWCTKFYNKFISSLYMFRAHVLIVRRAKLYYTVSGIITPVGGRPVHGTATNRCDDTRDCVIQFCPPDNEHMCSKHVEAWNKLIIKLSASSWLILINKYIEMHGQQNIKRQR